MTRTSLCVALATVAAISVAFQSSARLAEARKFNKATSAAADKALKSRQMFMLTRSGTWGKMQKDSDHLDKDQMWRDDIEAVAFYFKMGKSSYLDITQGSPSGDWSHSTELSYRADGSLAYANQTCSAFSPVDGVVIREYSFDAKGKSTGTATKGTDMEGKKNYTGQKLKDLIAMEKDFGFSLKPFMHVKKLPFAKLIK